MAHFPLDQVIVGLIVCGALAYLLHGWFGKKSEGSCGGCHGCGSAKKTVQPDPSPSLIQLEIRTHPRGKGENEIHQSLSA